MAHLITTLAEIRPYLPVGYANSLGALPPFNGAEERYVLPIVGSALLTQLQAAYDAATLTSTQQRLVAKIRAVLAPFAYVINLPFIQTQLTDNGLIALEAEHQRKAFKWEYNEVKEAMLANGYAAQELLISFLTANAGDYPLWADAPYNDTEEFGLVRNGADLKLVVGLQQPQRVYALIRPLFETVKEMYLRPLLGDDFYEALNTRLLAGTTTTEDMPLIRPLRAAAGRRAMELAAVEMSVQFVGSGFTVVDAGRMKDNEQEGKAGASMEQIQAFREQQQSIASVFTEQAVRYMNGIASVSVFPEFFASSLYVDPNAPVAVRHENDQRTGVFVAG